ncbi:glycosyltransferase family 52 [Moritella marina]|uniref:glycosyltransferase family 52 n=1 Tax=Moritella marina TaxID=90736 RepID=UPI0037044750
MNIYLCSTVRHLLFSLLKSLPESDDKSLIFMITDQQHINQTNFDCQVLPAHIDIIFIERDKLRNLIYSDVKGYIIKQMARFNVTTSPSTREKIRNLLFNQSLGLSLPSNDIEQGQLFLFNDRNKISRLFRLAFKKYTLIEEGLANYSGIKLNPLKKIYRLITLNKYKMRYYGDDKRCENLFLVNHKNVPYELRDKARPITFLQNKYSIAVCKQLFKIQAIENPQCILATQPLIETGIDLAIYRKVIDLCHSHNIDCVIKPHPSENTQRYIDEFPNIQLIESKIPLELILVGSPQPCAILSIYSTAGIGFEKYCKRINLIQDNEIEEVDMIFKRWRHDFSSIDKRIFQAIEQVK